MAGIFFTMWVSMNQISGSLPTDIAEIMPSIMFLLLSNNQINGSIPNSLCNLETLEILDISRNKLSGIMPHCWRGRESLHLINLVYFQLCALCLRVLPYSTASLVYFQLVHVAVRYFDQVYRR